MEQYQEEVQKGLKVVADLPDLMPDDADERLAPIYESVQSTLRVPIVNLIFRSLANYPDYLSEVWWKMQPLLNLQEFENASDELRRTAVIESFSGESIPLDDIEGIEKLRSFNNTIHYVLPKLLLIATALSEGHFGDKSVDDDLSEFPKMLESISPESAKASMLDPSEVDEEISNIFDSIKAIHGHPIVSSYYRALGNWPVFLERAWGKVAQIVGTQEFEDKKQELIEAASLIVKKLPNCVLSGFDYNVEDHPNISKILSAFRYEFIPEMMIDAAVIKTLLDGTEEAKRSKLSMGLKSQWDH